MAQYTEEEKLEQDTIKFLKKLGFKDVNGGKNFFVGGRQIDACGGHEKTLLVVECTTKKDISSKIDEFRGRIDFFRQDLLTHNVYKKYQKHKYILVIKNQEITETILGKSNKGMKIYLWNEKFIAFYQQLESAIKINARYSLLSEIDVKPEKTNPIEIPAFQAKVGMKSKYKIFSFLIDAKDLMEISFVARREMGGELFYQRMVNKSRLKEIASEYIDTGEKIFPNNIIVALADNSWEFKNEEIGIDMPNWLEFGKLKIGNSYNSCWIIDGQHRLFSHAHTTNKGKLTVSAFANIDEENQAEYFLDINRKARPVSPELLWDILGTIKPTSAEGIISNAVKDLRNSQSGFFEDNIKIPSLGTGKFSFHNLCDSLNKMEFGDKVLGFIGHKKNNPFSNNSHEKHSRNLAKAINNYFVEFDLRINDLIKPHLYSDGFISVLIYLYKILIVHFGKVPSKAELDPFLNIFCKNFEALSEEEATQVRKNLTSEGAKAQYRNSLVMYLQEKYDKNFGAGFIRYHRN